MARKKADATLKWAQQQIALRKKRCLVPLRKQASERLRHVRRLASFGTRVTAFTNKPVVETVQLAARNPSGFASIVRRAVINNAGDEIQEGAFAARLLDGRVAWDVCREDPTAPVAAEPTEDGVGRCWRMGSSRWLLKQWAHTPSRPLVERCPCSADDLVAIDRLAEAGDRRAERLAKECANGGGILEGSKFKHRRRKR